MFERTASGSWTEAAKLVASDRSTDDVFGSVVALAGDRAVVGAPNDTTAYGVNAGSAYLYERDASGAWTEVATLVASDSENDDAFGSAVALAGGRAVVGASNAAWVYVYEFGPVSDIDDDGVANADDNCIGDPNPLQGDVDADLIGDACDDFPDGIEVACGKPDIDVRRDRGLYVWQSCFSDTIHVFGSGGNAAVRFRGAVASERPLSRLSRPTIEDSDTVALSSTARRIDFTMNTGGIWDDEFRFVAPKSACIEVYERSEGAGLYVGRFERPVSGPFDPATGRSCTLPERERRCGAPALDSSTASGLYVWQECYGTWKVLFTGVGSNGGVVRTTGAIDSVDAFTSLQGLSLEPDDAVQLRSDNEAVFSLGTIRPWNDAFAFTIGGGEDICIRVDRLDTSLPIRLGPAQRLISTSSFMAMSGESCGQSEE